MKAVVNYSYHLKGDCAQHVTSNEAYNCMTLFSYRSPHPPEVDMALCNNFPVATNQTLGTELARNLFSAFGLNVTSTSLTELSLLASLFCSTDTAQTCYGICPNADLAGECKLQTRLRTSSPTSFFRRWCSHCILVIQHPSRYVSSLYPAKQSLRATPICPAILVFKSPEDSSQGGKSQYSIPSAPVFDTPTSSMDRCYPNCVCYYPGLQAKKTTPAFNIPCYAGSQFCHVFFYCLFGCCANVHYLEGLPRR